MGLVYGSRAGDTPLEFAVRIILIVTLFFLLISTTDDVRALMPQARDNPHEITPPESKSRSILAVMFKGITSMEIY